MGEVGEQGDDRKPIEQKPVSTQDQLNIALTRKAEMETLAAQRASSPSARWREWLSTISGLTGVLVALGTLVAGGVTVGKWFDERKKERSLQVEAQITSTLALLSSANAMDHAAAAASLGYYISADDQARNRRIALAVANAIASEKDFVAQRALTEFFSGLDYTLLDTRTKNEVLKSLAAHNRAFTAESDLHGPDSALTSDQGRALLHTLSSLATVMAQLIDKGAYARDLSNLFLADVNLEGAKLARTSFANSILSYSRFDGAHLEGVNFDNADIERTSFRGAYLQKATFRYPSTSHTSPAVGENRSQYDQALNPHAEYDPFAGTPENPREEDLPIFACANLSNAEIQGLPIASFGEGAASGIDFHGVDFTGAKFVPAFYFQTEKLKDFPFQYAVATQVFKDKRREVNLVVPADDAKFDWGVVVSDVFRIRLYKGVGDILLSTDRFSGSNWARAQSPAWVERYILSISTERDDGKTLKTCKAG